MKRCAGSHRKLTDTLYRKIGSIHPWLYCPACASRWQSIGWAVERVR